MIEMNNSAGIERTLKTLFPEIKNINARVIAKKYQTHPNTFFLNIRLKNWCWIGFGLIHKNFENKIKKALNVYGVPNCKYYVDMNGKII